MPSVRTNKRHEQAATYAGSNQVCKQWGDNIADNDEIRRHASDVH